MPAGRPTDYRPEYCQSIIDYMSIGYSFYAFAAEIGVCPDTINEWAKVHPEFSVAKKIANAKRVKWWEDRAMDRACGRAEKSEATCIFMLKNCAPEIYGDKHSEKPTEDNGIGKLMGALSTETLSAIARDLSNKPA